MDFIEKSYKEMIYYEIPFFNENKNVKTIFTSRIGFNKGNILNNLALLFDEPENKIVFSNQVHGNNISIIKDINFYNETEKPKGVDGLLTDKKNIVLATVHGDCVPLFFFDKKRKIIGLAHAGWRGTLSDIGGKMISLMKREFGSELSDIIVGIGPSIGPCCYEVGEEIYESFVGKHLFLIECFERKEGKYHLNLWRSNELLILRAGILKQNIVNSCLCTSCHNDRFYSYRKERTMERMAAGIKLMG